MLIFDGNSLRVMTHKALVDELIEVIPFDLEQSDLAAYYYAQRNAYQLSLSDRACLAMAESRGVEVLTAERAWAKLPDLPVKVKLIRP